jgi:hypothetical protein
MEMHFQPITVIGICLRTGLGNNFIPRLMIFIEPGPNVIVVPNEPTPPTTPDSCDATMVLDAVSTLRGEMLFFKGR